VPTSKTKAANGTAISLKERASHTFSSLKVRNYRLYFIGQTISQSGTWMQSVAQSLLVLKLVGLHTVAIQLGIVVGLQFAPVLFLAPVGGLLADRFSKRRLLFFTQTASALLALVLGGLVMTGAIRIWMLYILALSLGVVNAVDAPVRQSFPHELVGSDQLPNAIMLNSIIVNLSRVIGPAIAGIAAVRYGLADCFIANGISFVAVLVVLAMMRMGELEHVVPLAAARGQLRAGFRYAWDNRVVRDVLIMMALVGTLTYEFGVSLPLLGKVAFPGSEAQVTAHVTMLMSMMGVGAVVGGLLAAGRHSTSMRIVTAGAFGFGVAVALAALGPSLLWAGAAMVVVGFFSVIFTSFANALIQISSESRMRGRVMAIWAMAFMGSTVVGAPIVGLVAQFAGPRWGLGMGAAAALAAGLFGIDAMKVRAPALGPAGAVCEEGPA
jgi:MFS family permease